ncbi:MAG: RNA polymerase sigma factor [Micavibrio aeruginosavorus]|uniref:RNA polymerase sigma factor n=1 Tax=Micavibrio aeruginosavorus TaxID=349221 RepID=A0A7T5UG81_9BACT|nr:MAG: RNA polymerase sigma factor [Micavibrio aeruginosavorus]
MTADNDAELVKKAVRGDARAFEELVNRHYAAMFRMAFKWCGNRANAEDITQNACIKLARSLKTYEHKASFTTWLYRLVINTAIDMQRAEKRHDHAQTEADEMQGHENPESAYYAQEMMRQIGKLPEKEKTALLLVFGEGMNHAEAACVMAVKESTVSWYIHEARKKLEQFETRQNKERHHG